MQGGRIVEQGLAAQVLSAPRQRYTADLLAAVPRITAAGITAAGNGTAGNGPARNGPAGNGAAG
jgi:ABC-type dipeptide/oligopeptide/nickel transport system ATPase component